MLFCIACSIWISHLEGTQLISAHESTNWTQPKTGSKKMLGPIITWMTDLILNRLVLSYVTPSPTSYTYSHCWHLHLHWEFCWFAVTSVSSLRALVWAVGSQWVFWYVDKCQDVLVSAVGSQWVILICWQRTRCHSPIEGNMLLKWVFRPCYLLMPV